MRMLCLTLCPACIELEHASVCTAYRAQALATPLVQKTSCLCHFSSLLNPVCPQLIQVDPPKGGSHF